MTDHRKYKIVICTPALYSAGGTERVVAYKTSYFAERLGYDITIIVTEGMGDKTFFPLSEKVRIVNFGINFEEIWNKPFWKKVILYLKKQYLYKKCLKKELYRIRPDITISTLRREVNFIYQIKDGSVKVGELHLSRNYYRGMDSPKPGFLQKCFFKWWKGDIVKQLQKFDRVVFLTDTAAAEWPEVINKTVIPDPQPLKVTCGSSLRTKKVVAVGRYSYEKGYDLLLKIWSIVEKKCPEWELDIYGMGDPSPYVKYLTELSIDKRRCHLNACVADVSKVYTNSSILVQPSRTEGFGLVMVEAMAHGLPVVSFDCENGPRTIISDGEDGFLVPVYDINTFAERLMRLMSDEQLRVTMGNSGKYKSQRYDIEAITALWKQLFDDLMRNR